MKVDITIDWLEAYRYGRDTAGWRCKDCGIERWHLDIWPRRVFAEHTLHTLWRHHRLPKLRSPFGRIRVVRLEYVGDTDEWTVPR